MPSLLSCGQHWGWDSFSGSRTFRSHCVDSTRSETSEAMVKPKIERQTWEAGPVKQQRRGQKLHASWSGWCLQLSFLSHFVGTLKGMRGGPAMGAWSLCPTKGLGTFPGVVLDLPRKNEAGNGWLLFRRGVDMYTVYLAGWMHQAEHKLQLDAAAQRLKWGIPEMTKNPCANSWAMSQFMKLWSASMRLFFIEPTYWFQDDASVFQCICGRSQWTFWYSG